MINKQFLFSLCLLLMAAGTGYSQDIRLTVDRGTGALGLENVGDSSANMKGYSIGSDGMFLLPDAWSSLASAGQSGWLEANPSTNWLSELNRNSEIELASGQAIALGSAYVTGGHLGDIVFEYITSDRDVLQADVLYTGPANDFAVYVDPATGLASLANLSSFIDAPSIKGYSILSESGSLTANNWSSIASGGGSGWLEANPAAEHLSELNRNESMQFSMNTVVPLGQILEPGSDARDLVFEYFTESGEVLTGSVEYIPLPATGDGLRGDFNGDSAIGLADADLLVAAIAAGTNPSQFDLTSDSMVTAADLDVFLSGNLISDGNKLPGDTDFGGSVAFADFLTLSSNFGQNIALWSAGDFDGSGDVGFSDFLALSSNFGASSGGALASVPEPSGLALLLVGLAILPRRRR